MPLALTVWDLCYVEDLEEKDDLLTEIFNQGVCRTSLATLDLLKIASGGDKQTDRHTDIAETRLNQLRAWFREIIIVSFLVGEFLGNLEVVEEVVNAYLILKEWLQSVLNSFNYGEMKEKFKI